MNKLVLGFKSRKKDAEAEVLYFGKDGNEAREKLMNPGEGYIRTELSQPTPMKYRHFQTAEEIEAAENARKEAAEAAAKVAAEREKAKAEAAAKEEAPAAEEAAEVKEEAPAAEEAAEGSPAKKQGKKK